jgi:hypothetical protein
LPHHHARNRWNERRCVHPRATRRLT